MRLFMLHNISTMAVALSVGAALSSAAARGQNIYVANGGNSTIGKYTLSGAVVNSSLISGLSNPADMAVSGSNLFVGNQNSGTVGEYSTSGGNNQCLSNLGVK